MITEIAILATGSSGNAYYLSDGTTRLLLDAGISAPKLKRALLKRGIAPESIDAVLISHSHGDHASGLRGFIKDWQPYVYLTAGTAGVLRPVLYDTHGRFFHLVPEQIITIGTLRVLPMTVPHDDPEPVGFAILTSGMRCAFVADVGEISPSMADVIRDVDYLFLEANHDVGALRANQELPERRKRRVETHHLNNEQVYRFVEQSLDSRVRYLTLGHLSSSNNFPRELHEGVQTRLNRKGVSTALTVLPHGGESAIVVI